MSKHTGGTVTYHRANYDARLGDAPWEVWFSEDMMPVRFSAEQGEAMGLTPPIDFDALPIGTVLQIGQHELRVKVGAKQWLCGEDGATIATAGLAGPSMYTVVYQPPALSPRQCLEALLAGRDVAERRLLMAQAETIDPDYGGWSAIIGDAARGGA